MRELRSRENASMPFLDRDGVRVSYDVTGAGPVVLLTHGFASSSRLFSQNVDALAVDHTVVTWDIRGHAASDSPPDPAAYSVPLTLDDMGALLDAAGAERAVLGGHSLGGYLSLAFCLAHPERVDGLILIGTGPGFRSDDSRAGWNRFVEEHAATLGEPGLALAARGIVMQHDAAVIDGLPTIEVPALIVVGERDTRFLGGSRYMATKLPRAELVVIADAGHEPNVAQPAVFNEAVGAFLGKVYAAT